MAKAGDFFGVITAAVSDRRLIVGLDGLRPGSLAAVFGAVFGSAGVREALLAGAAAVPLVSGTLRGLVEVRIVGDPPGSSDDLFLLLLKRCYSISSTPVWNAPRPGGVEAPLASGRRPRSRVAKPALRAAQRQGRTEAKPAAHSPPAHLPVGDQA